MKLDQSTWLCGPQASKTFDMFRVTHQSNGTTCVYRLYGPTNTAVLSTSRLGSKIKVSVHDPKFKQKLQSSVDELKPAEGAEGAPSIQGLRSPESPSGNEVESKIEDALREVVSYIRTNNWRGHREREVISLFAFKFLTRKFKPGQIGIEVAVGQIEGSNKKKTVCKDLVIWGEDGMTVWKGSSYKSGFNIPLCIMEWKTQSKGRNKDIAWLQNYTKENETCIGYSVLLDLKNLSLSNYQRIVKGKDSIPYQL